VAAAATAAAAGTAVRRRTRRPWPGPGVTLRLAVPGRPPGLAGAAAATQPDPAAGLGLLPSQASPSGLPSRFPRPLGSSVQAPPRRRPGT
jgi:hypothetical protein